MSKVTKKECNNCHKQATRMLIQNANLSIHYDGGTYNCDDLDFCSVKCMAEWAESSIKSHTDYKRDTRQKVFKGKEVND